jgi:heat shock protein HspQ
MAREFLTALRRFFQRIRFSVVDRPVRRLGSLTRNPSFSGASTLGEAKFSIGEIVHHRIFDYRGVIFDIDFRYQGGEEWCGGVARSWPPKDQPWYHVLVDNAEHEAYVAERNLESGRIGEPICHPGVGLYFSRMENGVYIPLIRKN